MEIVTIIACTTTSRPARVYIFMVAAHGFVLTCGYSEIKIRGRGVLVSCYRLWMAHRRMNHLRQRRPIRLSGKKTKGVNYALYVAAVDVQVCERRWGSKKSIGHGAKIVLGGLSERIYSHVPQMKRPLRIDTSRLLRKSRLLLRRFRPFPPRAIRDRDSARGFICDLNAPRSVDETWGSAARGRVASV